MDDMTFGQLAEQYLESGLPRSLTGRPSHRDYLYIYQRFFDVPEWRDQPLSSIHRYQIMALNQDLARMPAHGNKVIGFIKQAFSWGQRTINKATRKPFFEGANPALRIERHRCDERERVMDHAEIALLLQQIGYFEPKYEALYTCRLLVPCRLKELCSMRRDAVNGTGKWVKGLTKNGRPHTIHIVPQAMERIAALPNYWRDPRSGEKTLSEYFFTGHYGQPLTTGAVQKQWRRNRDQLDMGDVWLLDFRRTLATYLYRVIRADELTSKALLNHYDGRNVAKYVKLDYDYLKAILEGYAQWVWQFKQEVPYEGAFSRGSVVGDPGMHNVTGNNRPRSSPAAAMVEQLEPGSTGPIGSG